MNIFQRILSYFNKILPSFGLIAISGFLFFSLSFLYGVYQNSKPDAYWVFLQKNAIEDFYSPNCQELISSNYMIIPEDVLVSAGIKCSGLVSIWTAIRLTQFASSRNGEIISSRDVYMTLKRIEDTSWKTQTFIDAVFFSILGTLSTFLLVTFFNFVNITWLKKSS
jgi:5-bromo-4-chloroindolyl phosphate hydrolysis protein